MTVREICVQASVGTVLNQWLVTCVEFIAGQQFTDYEENSMLRAAVERKFEIIVIDESEAILHKSDPQNH